MSGGSYDYISGRISEAADTMAGRHADKPHVVAFVAFLRTVSRVLHDIEWADSGDTGWSEELDNRIRALITPQAELNVTTEEAIRIHGLLLKSLERLDTDKTRNRP